MDREKILNVIKKLSQSQGYYCRLYNYLIMLKNDYYQDYNNYMVQLEKMNFQNEIDLVLYLEC